MVLKEEALKLDGIEKAKKLDQAIALLVQNGTLKNGDTVLAGKSYGRIKAMFDYTGEKIKEAGPSVPVSIMGLNNVPKAGELFNVVPSEKIAREVIQQKQVKVGELILQKKQIDI